MTNDRAKSFNQIGFLKNGKNGVSSYLQRRSEMLVSMMKDWYQYVKFCRRLETIFHKIPFRSKASRGQGHSTWWCNLSNLLDKLSKNVRFWAKQVNMSVSCHVYHRRLTCLWRGATAEQLPAFWTNTRGHPACAGSRQITTHCLPPVDIVKYVAPIGRSVGQLLAMCF